VTRFNHKQINNCLLQSANTVWSHCHSSCSRQLCTAGQPIVSLNDLIVNKTITIINLLSPRIQVYIWKDGQPTLSRCYIAAERRTSEAPEYC